MAKKRRKQCSCTSGDRQSSVAMETPWQTADVPGAFLNVFQEWV
ncbi:hypothetical protein AKN40_1850 [Escherichia coli]|nr:hypothetical protein AKN40_1850 [Escherichia coli]